MVNEKKKKEIQIRTLSSKLDHQVRAQRDLEIPYIKESFEEKSKRDKELYIEQTSKYLELHKKKWERDIELKKIISTMTDTKELFDEIEDKKLEEKKIIAEEKRKEIIKEYLKKRLPVYYEEKKKKEEEEKAKEEERRKKKEDDEKKKIEMGNRSREDKLSQTDLDELESRPTDQQWSKKDLSDSDYKKTGGVRVKRAPETGQWGKNENEKNGDPRPDPRPIRKDDVGPWKKQGEMSTNEPPRTQSTSKPWGKNTDKTNDDTQSRPRKNSLNTEQRQNNDTQSRPKTTSQSTSKPWGKRQEESNETNKPKERENPPEPRPQETKQTQTGGENRNPRPKTQNTEQRQNDDNQGRPKTTSQSSSKPWGKRQPEERTNDQGRPQNSEQRPNNDTQSRPKTQNTEQRQNDDTQSRPKTTSQGPPKPWLKNKN